MNKLAFMDYAYTNLYHPSRYYSFTWINKHIEIQIDWLFTENYVDWGGTPFWKLGTLNAWCCAIKTNFDSGSSFPLYPNISPDPELV